MNRLRGIKSLWCDKERGRVLESVSVCCLSGGGVSFNSSFSSVESFRIPSPSRSSLSEESLYLLFPFITLVLLAVCLCLSAFTPFPAERFRSCLWPPTSSSQFSSPAAEFPTAARSPGFSLRSPPAPAASSPPSSSGEG